MPAPVPAAAALALLLAVPAHAGAPPSPEEQAAAADQTGVQTGVQAVDHGTWQQVLDAHLDARGRVDYAAAAADPRLEAYVQSLATAPAPASKGEKLALWINAYNALTVALVADHWPLASIRDLSDGNPWDAWRFTVAGERLTLNELEHQRIRKVGDGRIHAVVNCASIGCPPLPPEALRASGVGSALDAGAKRWVATNALVVDKGANTARFNRIFDWYAEDFAGAAAEAGGIPGLTGKLADAAAWTARHADPETAAWLVAGGYQADWAEYDWGVNKQ